MDVEKFFQQLNDTYNRAAKFYQQTNMTADYQPEVVRDSLEELRIALEELQIAEEELIQQNQELALAHTELELERQRYYDLFESAPDGYIVTDENGFIQEVNRAAAKLFNLSPKLLIGKPLISFIPDAEHSSFSTKLNQACKQESSQEWELSICPRQANKIDVAVTVAAVYNWEGKPVSWRWLLRDITARKQAEETIRNIQLQNLQLQEATRLKSQFLAVMSHELRNPMNAIIGFSQILLRQSSPLLGRSQESMIQRIFHSGVHLLKLIDDILDFSKIEAGRLELHPQAVNLAELVTATTDELHSLIEQKNLSLKLEINLDNPIVINDSTRLRQILINLLSNAIKFTESGSVQVKVWELNGDRMAIAVKDTGIGITEVDLPRIFQEFWQVNQTLTRQHGGSGLGLAITQRLVQMMQGKITVESQLGQGSIFCVELPRRVSTSINC